MDEYGSQRDRSKRRLPGSLTGPAPHRPSSTRESGLQRVRRLSNWSLAALVVSVGATTAALTRTIPAATGSTTTVATPVSATAHSTAGTQSAPTLTSPVATSSASAVTASNAGAPASGPSAATAARGTPVAARDS